jgi:hypothetical protein
LAKKKSKSLNLGLVRDEFDADMLDENLDIEHHVEKNDETISSESDKENMQPPVDRAPDVPIVTGGKCNEANVPPSTVTLCDVLSLIHIDYSSITQTKS